MKREREEEQTGKSTRKLGRKKEKKLTWKEEREKNRVFNSVHIPR